MEYSAGHDKMNKDYRLVRYKTSALKSLMLNSSCA